MSNFPINRFNKYIIRYGFRYFNTTFVSHKNQIRVYVKGRKVHLSEGSRTLQHNDPIRLMYRPDFYMNCMIHDKIKIYLVGQISSVTCI